MHVAALQVYAAPAHGDAVTTDRLIETIRQRAHRIACFRRRLIDTPFGLDHPSWLEDATFDPQRHVFETELSSPGDWQALCASVARISATPLPRDRPLWEMHVIRGVDAFEDLTGDSFAVLTKLHHAAVDGVAGIGVTAALHDLQPHAGQPEPGTIDAEPVPTMNDLLTRSARRHAFDVLRVAEALPAIGRVAGQLWASPPPRPPRASFNGPVTTARLFDAVEVPLEDLQRARRHCGNATINDVVLTVVGGAMRRYFETHGTLPRRGLTAMVPISTRKELEAVGEGNQVSQMVVRLGTDVADPAERLRRVHEETSKGKTQAARIGPDALTTLSNLVPAPSVAFMARLASSPITMAPVNTVVTNVKVPPVPFYLCGARLVRAFGMGPLAQGLGVFHTALGYGDTLTLSVHACPQRLPDIGFYCSCLRTAYEELVAITDNC